MQGRRRSPRWPHGHGFIAMLSPVRKKSLRPKNPRYPDELRSLGDHVRARRLDLGLEQKDVAKILGVSTSSVTGWENNRRGPLVQQYPGIMDFLGYCPYERPETYGDRLRLHRSHRGLCYKKLARILRVDPASLKRWELRKGRPGNLWQKKIDWFVEYYTG